jgi:hypothetical protein
MGILSKKVYRDLRYSKGRSLSIILIVAIATGLYGGLFLAYENIVETFEGAEEEANIESVRFTMNFTDPSKINLGGINAIEDWDYRLNIITSLELLESDKTFTAVIFGVPADHEPRVNNILIDDDDGEYFKDNQSRSINSTWGIKLVSILQLVCRKLVFQQQYTVRNMFTTSIPRVVYLMLLV